MNVLDLFSGIGGFSLGLERAGMRTVAFCEIDPYCRAVLRKHWPDVPIHDNIRTLAATLANSEIERQQEGRELRPDEPAQRAGSNRIDLICGGFPCQPFSVAGKRRGAEDDRHLWPEMLRVIQAVRPSWVIGENVAGLINMGLDSVLSDLDGAGFEVQPFVIPACAVDAPHRRDRLWIVAHADNAKAKRQRQHGGAVLSEPKPIRSKCGGQSIPDTNSEPQRWPAIAWGECSQWLPEPDVGRVAHGVPSRVDRLRALGNAVVPQIPEIIGRAIMQAEGLT